MRRTRALLQAGVRSGKVAATAAGAACGRNKKCEGSTHSRALSSIAVDIIGAFNHAMEFFRFANELPLPS